MQSAKNKAKSTLASSTKNQSVKTGTKQSKVKHRVIKFILVL